MTSQLQHFCTITSKCVKKKTFPDNAIKTQFMDYQSTVYFSKNSLTRKIETQRYQKCRKEQSVEGF